MIDKNTNSLWYIALSKKGALITNKPYIFDWDDFYARPPYFRFRFKNCEKDSPIYKELNQLIREFNGNLKWCMLTKPETKNFIIIPEMFIEYLSEITVFDKKYMSERYGKNYSDFFDLAAEDIQPIAELLEG